MKRNSKHTREELLMAGWKFLSFYGFKCEIWGKDKDKLLWNQTNYVVEFTF